MLALGDSWKDICLAEAAAPSDSLFLGAVYKYTYSLSLRGRTTSEKYNFVHGQVLTFVTRQCIGSVCWCTSQIRCSFLCTSLTLLYWYFMFWLNPWALLYCMWLGGILIGCHTCDQYVTGLNSSRPSVECNPRQVVNTHVPLSPSSIIWYRPMGGDALWLGR